VAESEERVDLSPTLRSDKSEEPERGRAFEDVPRRGAGAVNRRGSLMTLGGAALAAAIARPPLVHAGKIARKARKRSQKKCKKQVDECRARLIALCNGDPECEAIFLPCCSDLSDCQAGKSLDCFFAHVN
jgi:hypothetical protein